MSSRESLPWELSRTFSGGLGWSSGERLPLWEQGEKGFPSPFFVKPVVNFLVRHFNTSSILRWATALIFYFLLG
jgi:hypothetical protein